MLPVGEAAALDQPEPHSRVVMVTDLPVGEDAALGQPEPQSRVGVVHLDGFCQTVERLLGPAGVQERDASVVDELVVARSADGVDRHAAVPVSCPDGEREVGVRDNGIAEGGHFLA